MLQAWTGHTVDAFPIHRVLNESVARAVRDAGYKARVYHENAFPLRGPIRILLPSSYRRLCFVPELVCNIVGVGGPA